MDFGRSQYLPYLGAVHEALYSFINYLFNKFFAYTIIRHTQEYTYTNCLQKAEGKDCKEEKNHTRQSTQSTMLKLVQ